MIRHRIWRRLAKKARRKRIRQALAKERDAKEAEGIFIQLVLVLLK